VPRISLRTAFPFLVAGLATMAGVLPAKEAAAVSPYLVVPAASVAEATAAYKYANMTAAEAIAELDRRKIPYTVADPIDGVMAPVRLTGKLHGVHIHSSIPESQRATSVYEVLDARLALALDDFAKILSRHDIEEVVHYSLYRPNVPREDHDLKEVRAGGGKVGATVVAAAKETSETPPQDTKGTSNGLQGPSRGQDEASRSSWKASRTVGKASGAPAVSSVGTGKASGVPSMSSGAVGKVSGVPSMSSGAAGKASGVPSMSSGAVGKASGSPARPPGAAGKGAGGSPKAPATLGKAPGAKTGAPGTKPAAALPALPQGKVFPAPPSKGSVAPAHGAKQKTPAAGNKPLAAEKKTGTTTPATAPSTKAGATSAAGRTVTPAGGRGIGPRAAATSPKAGVPHARARAGAAAKVGPRVAVTPAAAVAPVAAAAGAKSGAKGASPAPAVAAVASVEHAHAHSHGAPKSRQSWAAPGTRHPAGLAIDVAMLKKRDGQWISVANHFRGKIGDKTCGDGVRTGDTPEARELRSIVCEANDLGVFTYVLTPNYNAAHHDHFHMEIRPQVKWFLYH
jgi:hypothetical protein